MCANARRRGHSNAGGPSLAKRPPSRRAFRIPTAEITGIYNGIPMTKTDKQSGEGPASRLAASERAALRRELASHGRPTACYPDLVARLDESKG
jgi:hypothetical protein